MATESGIFSFENKDGTVGIVVKFGGKIGVGFEDEKTYLKNSIDLLRHMVANRKEPDEILLLQEGADLIKMPFATFKKKVEKGLIPSSKGSFFRKSKAIEDFFISARTTTPRTKASRTG